MQRLTVDGDRLPGTVNGKLVEYCMSGDELRKLNGYMVRLEDLAHKYECEITVINGGKCP